MQDVARVAGVATMTVSRVMRGSAPVGYRTRSRVLQAIHLLDYRPNEVARSLRESKSRQVGIIVPNLCDPFYAACVHAVGQIAKSHGYSVITTLSDEDPDTEFAEATRLRQRQVDGLIVIPAWERSRLLSPELAGIPVVVLDRPVLRSTFDTVLVENRQGAREAVQHLISHGYKSIAYIGLADGSYTMHRRLLGYRMAMAASGLQAMEVIVSGAKQEMLEAMRLLVSSADAPRAMLCSNNLASKYALHALVALGVRIPEDVAFIGFDDFELADLFRPQITVVRQDAAEMARIAAELLMQRLTPAGRRAPRRQVRLPVSLVVRESCGCHM